MKKTLFATLLALFFISSNLSAQDYSWAIGGRGGLEMSGLTAKYNFNPINSIETIVGFTNGINAVVLYEHNVAITKSLDFYYGAGVNAGKWRENHKSKFSMGVDGIVGLEYKIKSAPLAFSLDYKPFFNFTGHTGLNANDIAIGIKVTF